MNIGQKKRLKYICGYTIFIWTTALSLAWNGDVIKWKHFPRYWPLVWGIHWSPVNSLHKGQWRGALMFSLICASRNGWVNNPYAGDLRPHYNDYDVPVILWNQPDLLDMHRWLVGMRIQWPSALKVFCMVGEAMVGGFNMPRTMHHMPRGWISQECKYTHREPKMLSLIARFMGPTWGPYGADKTQVGPMLAPKTLLSGIVCYMYQGNCMGHKLYWKSHKAMVQCFDKIIASNDQWNYWFYYLFLFIYCFP